MCGIAALLNLQKDRQISSIVVENMLESISHRGRDDRGVFQSKDVVLGLNRLSILDLSTKGNQPMSKHGYQIIFNGLIYNYLEIREELEKEGVSFDSKSDTEVILSAFHRWGKECVERFNGMWAFIIYDEARKSLFISRDRYGIKPLYYYRNNRSIYFASEIKAFSKTEGWRPQINNNRVYDFLKFGLKNHTPETLFSGVNMVEAGSWMEVNCQSGKIDTSKFYSLSYNDKVGPPDFKEATAHFRALFNDSLTIRLRSELEIGMSLSGGLDSSAIALELNTMSENRKMHALCSGSTDPKYDETPFANLISERCNFNLHKIAFSKNQINQLEKVIIHQGEPFPGASVIAQNQVFNNASALGLKVMFSGQGADEYLMGYDAFLSLYFLNKNPMRHPLSFISFLWNHKKTIWQKNIIRKKPFEPPVNLNIDHSKIYIPESICELKERAHQYFTKTVLPSLLHFEDHNSMAYGIESRLPFLDYRIVDFCFSLPEHYFMHKGARKRILREAFKNDYPSKIYNRYDKSAFSNPLYQWIKTDPNYFRSLLKENEIDLQKIKDPGLLWRLIGFGIWKRVYNISA